MPFVHNDNDSSCRFQYNAFEAPGFCEELDAEQGARIGLKGVRIGAGTVKLYKISVDFK